MMITFVVLLLHYTQRQFCDSNFKRHLRLRTNYIDRGIDKTNFYAIGDYRKKISGGSLNLCHV